MTSSDERSAAQIALGLVSHPQRAAPDGVGVDVQLAVLSSGWVECTFSVRADEGRLSYPSPLRPLDPERLWEHTCAELFVSAGAEAYEEWNFSPTGQVAHFEFDNYRQRRTQARRPPANVTVEQQGKSGSIELRAAVPVAAAWAGGPFRLSPTMVVVDDHGQTSYWALQHPRPQPDFHDRAGFGVVLTLDPVVSIARVG